MQKKYKKTVAELFLENLEKKSNEFSSIEENKQIDSIKNLPQGLRYLIAQRFEKEIIQKLECLGEVKFPSKQEDAKYKIDGFLTPKENSIFSQEFGNNIISIQIKRRVQNGDDILYEVKKDFDNDIVGRDEKCSTDLYIVQNRKNQIGVFKTKRIKRVVEFLLEKTETKQKLEYYKHNIKKTGLVNSIEDNEKKIELRVTKGNPNFGNEGFRKLLAFINFELGEPIVLI